MLAEISNLEVIVSDRHKHDDCLEQLQQIHHGDRRFQFCSSTDELDWVAHFNWLLTQGSGTYFSWMPHDDSVPPGHFDGLVAHLDAHPETVLAFGPIVGIDGQEQTLRWSSPPDEPPPWHMSGRWSRRHVRSLLRHLPWEPIHGAFRRETIIRSGLFIRPTVSNQSADRGWVYGVSLRGAVQFVAVPPIVKRYYPESTFRATMPRTFRSYSSLYPALAHYTIRQSPTRLSAAIGLIPIAWHYLAHMIGLRFWKGIGLRNQLGRLRRRMWN